MCPSDTRRRHKSAALKARRGIVLNDKILEVSHPHGSIGANLSMHRGVPFITAGVNIEEIESLPTCAIRLHIHKGHHLHRGLADHGFALKSFRQRIAINKIGARSCGVSTEDVHLTEVRCDRVALVHHVDLLGRQAARPFRIHCGWNASEEDRRTIGRSTELIARIVGAVAPRIVRELMQKLDRTSIRFETICPHGELLFFATDVTLNAAVADAAVDPIVEAVMQIAGLSMGVSNTPAINDRLTLVSLVIAIGVFQVNELRRCRHNDAFAGKHDARG